MGAVSYQKLDRLLARCAEMHTATAIDPHVVLAFGELESTATTYRTAHAAARAAEDTTKAAHVAAAEALALIDQPYRTVRSILIGHGVTIAVPDTLKEQPTDTEQREALQQLSALLGAHRGQPWADALIAGPFGTQIDDVVTKVSHYIDLRFQLDRVLAARAAAFHPAYAAFLLFKDVVRQALGSHSAFYRRIHVRGAVAAEPTPETTTPETSVTAPPHTASPSSPVASATPSNGSTAATPAPVGTSS